MITFLNDKQDWQLRGAFFDSIVGVAAYFGWHSLVMLRPLLEQGLSDTEEFVVSKALNALTCLVELGLLQKPALQELVSEIAPFLCHSVILVSLLKGPINRSVYDFIVKSQHVVSLLDSLQDRQLVRNLCSAGQRPNYHETDEDLIPVFSKLHSQGITEDD
ncbi:phosphoinositide 3-kinase regulatory subunit 4-like [Acropora millepora]|uniref:phosphoinositide 3-kinase regulatory subunit 4-like n=1 Tax=Acropora millepora TaxID=45264 RepID=UPI001CF1D74F|nr:phosphoinositide 3-kinase regulatory subunit 4-like [Acropora millepora]